MPTYALYLERAEERPWTAHVLDLPGCFARGNTRQEAVAATLPAIRAYHAWLRRHGEPAPPENEPITCTVAEEGVGSGFYPGDAAALFSPEKQPISPQEMERHFRLLAHSRADLLALVEGLPEAVLERKVGTAPSVGDLLRHIGNAEEWYVSRLVPPETLPPEWEKDAELPLAAFLEMERWTALERLRRLTPEERSRIAYSDRWTARPEEPWTARKALRRFLEHEREHTAQIGDLLELQRRHLLACLAHARADLWMNLLGLPRPACSEAILHGDWTLQDALAHIAGWDRWALAEGRRGVAGRPPDLATVRDLDRYNAASVSAWQGRSLEEVVAEVQQARAEWVAWMEALALPDFFRSRPVGRWDWFPPTWVEVMVEHDREHIHEIAHRREEQGLSPQAGQVGPRCVLRAALTAAHTGLLAALRLFPPEERTGRILWADWTPQDLLGHLLDWEEVTLEGLRRMAAGQDPPTEEAFDLDAWNQAHVEARRGRPWEETWAALEQARHALLEALEAMPEETLGRSFTAPWNEPVRPYDWVRIQIEHEYGHAGDLLGLFG